MHRVENASHVKPPGDPVAGHGASQPPGSEERAPKPVAPRWRRILTRVLQLSFLFFLLKGIAWLVVGWFAWQRLS